MAPIMDMMPPMARKEMTASLAVIIGTHVGRFCCVNLESAEARGGGGGMFGLHRS